ncbi:hypothetical protein GCM10011610_64250 [Nocardia rhizosphaerihabitans]|uniref:Reverse transcriptase domain-containing protein n=1 Tax=Nocardia rhizosphaerihabitans TaxID=1691570 RepID=A0ABQ2KZM7_9NOCA|nr:hypothetical protein GCM10011610_64250 [Nocardia rhizosphaerihabitans]
MNSGESWPDFEEAGLRVRRMQTKLHWWAVREPDRVFDDLYNLVHDPAFLIHAWERVHGNKGGRTAGIDGVVPREIPKDSTSLLSRVRSELKGGSYRPDRVREKLIPKPGNPLRKRRLGIPTAADRVVQAALKLVLEPIFEADFQPSSYGFRPRRRAQDAIAEIHHFGIHGYRWVLEADIEACFDRIDHTALMDRVRHRVADKRVLSLVKAFLKSGILSEEGIDRDTHTGTPQGGILSPLLANIALSVLDEHYQHKWDAVGGDTQRKAIGRRSALRAKGGATYRLVRYADDFVVLVNGQQHHAEQARAEVAQILAPMGLALSEPKTRVVHMDEGFDFLGWRIQRRTKAGDEPQSDLHLPVEEVLELDRRQGAVYHSQIRVSLYVARTSPQTPWTCCSGLVYVFPTRCPGRYLPLPVLLFVEEGRAVADDEASAPGLAKDQAPLSAAPTLGRSPKSSGTSFSSCMPRCYAEFPAWWGRRQA